MPLVVAGIDEAGYGPMLGPLVVARAVLRVERWLPGEPAPDFWQLLTPAVTDRPSDPRRRIPVADSKKLKLSNDTPDPLIHLRRGVAAMLAQLPGVRPGHIADDDALLTALGVGELPQAWYAPVEPDGTPPTSSATTGSATASSATASSATTGSATDWASTPSSHLRGIDANMLAGALTDAGVQALELRVRVIDEAEFNDTLRQHATKAATTALALGEHLRHLWAQFANDGDGPRVVCDRQGGRQAYGDELYNMLPTVRDAGLAKAGGVTMLEETPQRSRYLCEVLDPPVQRGRLSAVFQTEGESAHLPIALASMAAKLTRELLMKRFNAYWRARAQLSGVALKPTAGYVQDARRWLTDAKPLLTPDDRTNLVRRA